MSTSEASTTEATEAEAADVEAAEVAEAAAEEAAEAAEAAEVAEAAEAAKAQATRLWRHRLAEENAAAQAHMAQVTPATAIPIDGAQEQRSGYAEAAPSRCEATPRIMDYYYPPQLLERFADQWPPTSPVPTPATRPTQTPQHWSKLCREGPAKTEAKKIEVVVYHRNSRGERMVVHGREFAP